MPKHRKAAVQEYCSFCGDHKEEVPLLISSPMMEAAICTTCSLTMVHQNVSWASGVFKSVQADHERRKKGAPKLILPDAAQEAISKVSNGKGK